MLKNTPNEKGSIAKPFKSLNFPRRRKRRKTLYQINTISLSIMGKKSISTPSIRISEWHLIILCLVVSLKMCRIYTAFCSLVHFTVRTRKYWFSLRFKYTQKWRHMDDWFFVSNFLNFKLSWIFSWSFFWLYSFFKYLGRFCPRFQDLNGNLELIFE